MKRTKYLAFVLVAITLLLTACSGSPTVSVSNTPAVTLVATPTATAGGQPQATAAAQPTLPNIPTVTPLPPSAAGVTMRQGYLLAEPQLKKWQSDGVLVAIFNSLDGRNGISPDGRSVEWFFQVVSVKAGKRGTWLVKTDSSAKTTISQSGDEELPADRLKALSNQALPPVANIIDSGELMNIAKANGGDRSDQPIGFRLAMPPKEGDPLAFDLVFYQGSKTLPLRIDALSGKVLDIARG